MANENIQSMSIKKALQGYKSLRATGISIKDICNLINWDYAKKMASDSGLVWLKIAVSALSAVCLLAPDGDKLVDAIVEKVDKEIV